LLTGELIAVEIVRMLVGSIGLVASVPITTGLAALVMGTGESQRVGRGLGRAPGPADVAGPAPVAAGSPGQSAGAGHDDPAPSG
jgi:hypothetical protein